MCYRSYLYGFPFNSSALPTSLTRGLGVARACLYFSRFPSALPIKIMRHPELLFFLFTFIDTCSTLPMAVDLTNLNSKNHARLDQFLRHGLARQAVAEELPQLRQLATRNCYACGLAPLYEPGDFLSLLVCQILENPQPSWRVTVWWACLRTLTEITSRRYMHGDRGAIPHVSLDMLRERGWDISEAETEARWRRLGAPYKSSSSSRHEAARLAYEATGSCVEAARAGDYTIGYARRLANDGGWQPGPPGPPEEDAGSQTQAPPEEAVEGVPQQTGEARLPGALIKIAPLDLEDLVTELRRIQTAVLEMIHGGMDEFPGVVSQKFAPRTLTEALKVILDIHRLRAEDDSGAWPTYKELIRKITKA